jgi:TPR repeat protein
MEKKLSRNELLSSLLRKAMDPFTTMEQKLDVKRILMESVTMQGMNHLFLVKCHFEEKPLFHVDEEEAYRQAMLAYKENNAGAFYYLYLLMKDKEPRRARNYLMLGCEFGDPKAYYAIAECYHHGNLFPKDPDKAYENYFLAAKSGIKEGYFGMLLLASEEGNEKLEMEIYEEAKEKGIVLPGVIK